MKIMMIIWWVISLTKTNAQSNNNHMSNWLLSGYIKDIEYFRFDKKFSDAFATNLVHNRVNLIWKPAKNTEIKMAIRNRIYWGDDVVALPNLKDDIKNENEIINLSTICTSKQSFLFHSNIERFSFEYRRNKWNLRAGRQRINWGLNNIWNPNDIFNTYNLFDFDYEERPGSDAIKLQYTLNQISTIEWTFSGTNEKSITATRFFTNYHKYDLQIITGLYKGILTAGIGWAGNISEIGFKGECQFYGREDKNSSQLNLSIEGDYIFKKGWYLSSSILFNELGNNKTSDNFKIIDFKNSPRNLMPAKWNYIINSSKEITPLLNVTIDMIYSAGIDLIILIPSLKYNLKSNLDADITGQSYFTKKNKFEASSHSFYFRLKWSF